MATYTLADNTFLSMSDAILQSGRVFDREDDALGQRVAIVNQALADRVVAAASLGGTAVGRTVRLSGLGVDPFLIVGVVADSHAHELGRTDGPRLYYSPAQLPAGRFVVLVEGSPDTSSLAATVRRAVHDIDAQLPVLELQTVAQAIERTAAQPRWASVLVPAVRAARIEPLPLLRED